MTQLDLSLHNRIIDFYGQDALGSIEIKKFYLGLGNLISVKDWNNSPLSTDIFNKIDNIIMLKVHNQKYFVTPDDNGCIITNDGNRWSRSNNISPYIYLQFSWDFNDLPSEIDSISQIFICTNIVNLNNKLILYPDIDFNKYDIGYISFNNIKTIYKNKGTREIINLVVNIINNEWQTSDGYNQTFDIPSNYDPNYKYT